MADNLVSRPLNTTRDLNWILLIELLVCGILAIFFFGYFDRVFATLVSYGIRTYTWRNFRAYIDIQAIQISLLGGRIFFKELRYHAHNETIIVHSGYITWKYWYRKVRDAEIFTEPPPKPPHKQKEPVSSSSSRSRTPSPSRTENGGVAKQKRVLPCRIDVKVEGVQAFLYNRSPVYDAIVDHYAKATSGKPRTSVHEAMNIGKTTSSDTLGSGVFSKLESRLRPHRTSDKSKSAKEDELERTRTAPDSELQRPKIPAWLQLFPIRVRCKTAAAVLGNDNTKAIITAKLDSADGTFDAGHAGELDLFKLLFKFEFTNTVIRMKPNLDFKETQLAMAANLKNDLQDEEADKRAKKQQQAEKTRHRKGILGHLFRAGESATSVRAVSPGHNEKGTHHVHAPDAIPGQERWQGLSRYLDEDVTNEHDEWDPVEYALYSTLAEVPKIAMVFYWDIPGPVPPDQEMLDFNDIDVASDINGSAPPAYGMDLNVFGGLIHYGPWADRQRIQFQNIFFPPNFCDAIPASKLLPGETRIHTVFSLFLSVEEDTTLRIPVREPSKDWKWKGKAGNFTGKSGENSDLHKEKSRGRRMPFWRSKDKGSTGPNIRPFAWLDLDIKKNTTVSYAADMIARPTGYNAKVDLEVAALEISTSVNHGLLWRSGTTRLKANVSVPQGWNALREWTFNIRNDDLELFILRDHLFLMIDIIADWSSGPLAEYFTFVPYKYLLNVCFRNWKMYLNTNTSNIIDDPADFDKNQFIILYGEDLKADVIIPLDKFRPERNEIFFDVFGINLGLQLCLSPGNTVAAFLGPKKVAELDSVSLKGSHAAWSETSTNLTDRLTFKIHGDGLKVYMFGFVVNRLVTLKENYFGDDLHFRTLEEFQDMARGKELAAESDAKAQQSNRANDLDIILIISASNIHGYLPSNIYNGDESITVDCPFASADLRLNNYYMDLEVDLSPLSVSNTIMTGPRNDQRRVTSETEVFIASTRLVGHRTFGLPPKEPDYLCLWDVDVGPITGECTETFVNLLVRAGAAFAATLDDEENATALVDPIVIHDIQFLKLRTQDIKLWFHIGPDALLLSTGPAIVDLNDWAGQFSQRVKVLVPDLTVALVDAQSASRSRINPAEATTVETHALLRTTVSLIVLKRKLHFLQEVKMQQEHVVLSDSRTHRTAFLIHGSQAPSRQSLLRDYHEAPASIYPPIPDPLRYNGADRISIAESTSEGLRRQISGSSSIEMSRKPSSPVPRLSKKSSRSSLASSVRQQGRPAQPGRFFSAVQHIPSGEPAEKSQNTMHITPQTRRFRADLGLPYSAIALSSPLAAPYFPLLNIEPDASDLPHAESQTQKRTDLAFSEFSNRETDEEVPHTSLIISAESGIQCSLKPAAVSSICALLDLVVPKTPDELLDVLQVKVISQLLSLESRKKSAGSSLEVSVRVPYVGLRLLNSFQGAKIGPQSGIDQYDIQVNHLALTLRDTKQPVHRNGGLNNSFLVHCAAESIAVTINERKPQSKTRMLGCTVILGDLLLWLTISSKTSVHVSFRSLDFDAESKQLQTLAAIIQRSWLLADDSLTKIVTIIEGFNERLRYLVYSLTMNGTSVPDPPFLNRAGIALRIAPHHLRNHDSWKIISRLRYIWQSMTDAEKQSLENECRKGGALYPANAQQVVTTNWDNWRTWDLAHVKKSHVMLIVYGGNIENDSSILAKESRATELQIRSGAVRITIDPGKHQTQFSVTALTLNLDLSPPFAPSGLMLVQSPVDVPIEDILLHASAKSIMLRVNWEIIHLVELVLKFIDEDLNRFKLPQTHAATPSDQDPPLKSIWRSFQIVVSVGNVGLGIDTPNLNVLAASKEFRLSIVGTDKSASDNGRAITALLHAGKSYIECRSHAHHLMHLGSDDPSLFISHNTGGSLSGLPDDLRIAGTTSNVAVDLQEELLGLIEAIDRIFCHEVAIMIKKFHPFMPSSSPETLEHGSRVTGTLPKIAIALIMDTYRFDVTLLPSLKFAMYGSLGRFSVSPKFARKMSLDINLDLGERSHDLISRDAAGTHVISVLKMPPLNGNVKIDRSRDRVDIELSMIIETIVFEAHALHGLLSVLGEDEVTSTFKAIVADVKTLQQDIKSVLPESKSTQTPIVITSPSNDKVSYNAKISLAGVKIKADAPGKLRDSGTAELLISLDCLHFEISNLNLDTKDILPLPEVHARMREFVIDLRITDARGTRRSGNLSLAAAVHCTLRKSRKGQTKRNYRAQIDSVHVNIFAETASAVIDVLNHLQDRLKDVDLSKERKYLRRLRQPSRRASSHLMESMQSEASMTASGLLDSYISVSLNDIQVAWIVGNSVKPFPRTNPEDLVLYIRLIDLSTKSENSSSLKIQDLQIQLVPPGADRVARSLNSAHMPQVIFNVGYASNDEERKLAFQATGESVNVLLDSKFMLPVNVLQRSIELAIDKFRDVSSSWQMTPTASGAERKKLLGDKRLASLLVNADFAGATLQLQGLGRSQRAALAPKKLGGDEEKHGGRYGQFLGDEHSAGARIETPGLAIKVQYTDNGMDSLLHGEVKISGSSNTLVPTVVPLILDVSDTIKMIVAETQGLSQPRPATPAAPAALIDESLLTADPSELLGGTSINLGIRICRQEFSLSCQPIARVAASAHIDDIYITANNVKSTEHEHFIAVSARFDNMQASIQHIYSRESTFNFAIQAITLSIMNSKHLSGKAGICAILKVFPMRTQINARQLQDFLLFREIWLPPEIRSSQAPQPAAPTADSHDYFVARYQQVTSTAAFPWTATLQIAELRMEVDMGQSIGKAALTIENLWACSKKDSNWEQNLVVGIGQVGVDCTGRTSGFVDLSNVRVRTKIAWPAHEDGHRQTPSVLAAAGFERLRVKAAFDYQAFGIADITSFDFLMYNVRAQDPTEKDSLVAMLEGDEVHLYCTATTASQALALFQAFEKLRQDTETAYANSLKDIERFLRRQSMIMPGRAGPSVSPQSPLKEKKTQDEAAAPINLYTDVVVTLRSIQVGAFPSAFFDSQILLFEASDVQARFAAMIDHGKVRTALGMTLGQLQVALTAVQHPTGPRTLQEITVDDVVQTAGQSRGGTILRVPKVIASMETWQVPGQMVVEYIFKSRFEGKVDVGWNVGRISFIREIYNTHARNLASRMGKPLPESALKITTESLSSGAGVSEGDTGTEPEKITAVVNVPQSKYTYIALEPPIIETPQLRDMGEATPPLEWIGLHRDRLPNVTHQIIIVGLMGIAREVEDAYGRILGNT